MASRGDRKKCAINSANTDYKQWWMRMVKMSGIGGYVKRSTIVKKLERTGTTWSGWNNLSRTRMSSGGGGVRQIALLELLEYCQKLICRRQRSKRSLYSVCLGMERVKRWMKRRSR